MNTKTAAMVLVMVLFVCLGVSRVAAQPTASPDTIVKAAGLGSNGSVLFNDHGKLEGASNFFWSKDNKRLGIGTPTPAEQFEITGNLRLAPSGPGGGVIMIGEKRFIHSFGDHNTFVGVDAGNLSTSGEGNTGVGTNALSSNTAGTCNTAVGAQTLKANTVGNNNTALGHWALQFNTSGEDNTATGVLALYYNSTGSKNTADGDNTLTNNGSGYENTALGTYSLNLNTEGAGNTASGYYALSSNTLGNDNVAAGWHALDANTVGYFNTAIGAEANVSSAGLHNATAVGAQAVVDASDKIRFGNDSVRVIEGRVPYTWSSDANQKENLRPVDGDEVLKKIRSLNLSSWNYIGDNPRRFRHYGPLAQEFFAAFGQDDIGTSGTPTTINSGDEAGILMIAVQALEKRTAEVENLKVQLAELRAIVCEQLPRSPRASALCPHP